MRAAKFADFWRKIDKLTPAHSAIKKIINGENSFEVAALQVVAGQNGSGKSTLLRFMGGKEPGFKGSLAALLFEKQTSNLPNLDESTFHFASPSGLVEENDRRIHDLAAGGQFAEILQSLSPLSFNEEQLWFANHILCSSFSQIEIFELEMAQEYDSKLSSEPDTQSASENSTISLDLLDDRALYILASTPNGTTNSLSLSQGEKYIILFTHILSAQRGKSILFDEPETYLSPLSQYRLADFLAYLAVEKKNQFVIATHSICFIEQAGFENTLLLTGSHGQNFTIQGNKTANAYLRRLGHKIPRDHIIFFEDKRAVRFFVNLVKYHDAELLSSFECIPLSGESDITAIISRIRARSFIACYDGDQRGKTDPSDYQNHRVVFLPGNHAPEGELIQVIFEEPRKYSEIIRVNYDDFLEFVRLSKGDLHDFFIKLSHHANRTDDELFDAACSIWNERNTTSAKEFLNSIC